MKHIIFFLTIIPTLLFSEKIQLCPLQEDKPGFQTSRILLIENSVDEIERITRVAPDYIRHQIDWNILMIRLNLGYPIDEDEIFNYFED